MPIYFPAPTPEMEAHSAQVEHHLRQAIQEAGGALSFARFMELALYAPGLGYYSSGAHKLGQAGDFVTAPEISPLFAKAAARQFAEILAEMPGSDILELGAGSGSFAKEVLLELLQLQAAPFRYFILEPSADLRQRQEQSLKEHCPHLLPGVSWLDQLPDKFRGLIFANEVLDALPVHRFRIEQQQIKECAVSFRNNQFEWALTNPSEELKRKATALMQEYALPNGYESEINLLLPHWIETLGKLLEEGVMIFFDYGYGRQEYYHPERKTGTLRCYYQHHCHSDPFRFIGLQDLTAQVDFTTVAESAMDAKLDLAGYSTQSSFLLACGITDLAEAAAAASPLKQYQQNQALKLLMLPSEMGTLVKAMALSKNWEKPLIGFSLFDKRHEL